MPISSERPLDRSVELVSPRWLYATLLIMALATLSPQTGTVREYDFFAPPSANPGSALRDILQNVLLYVPFGALLRLNGLSIVRVAFLAAAFSFATELVQHLIPGRDPVALDVLTNLVGALTGAALMSTRAGKLLTRCLVVLDSAIAVGLRPQPRLATRLSLAWAFVVVLIFVVTGWLLSPSLPPSAFYAAGSQYADSVPGPVQFGGGAFVGRLDEVRIYARARSAEEIQSDMNLPLSGPVSSGSALVAAYGFDSDEHESASESSQPALSAVVEGAEWTNEGRFGGALTLHGPSSRIVVPARVASRLSQAITFEAWVYPTSAASGEASVIALANDSYYLQSTSEGGALVPSSGGRFGSLPRFVSARRRLPLERWSHLATTFDGHVMRLYVDGRLAASRVHWSTHRLLDVWFNDAQLPTGRVRNALELRRLLTTPFTLKVSLECGGTSHTWAPVFVIGGLRSIDALSIDAKKTELRVRYALNAGRAELAAPSARFPGALTGCEPRQRRTFVVSGPLQRLRITDDEGRRLAGVAPSLGALWTVVFDSHLLPARLVGVLSLVSLAVLMFPYGFWVRAAFPSLAGAMVLGAGLIVVPAVFELPALESEGFVSILAGVVLGVLLSRRR